jgi:hypothetical protein
MGEMRNLYKILFCKPEGKEPLRRCWWRWDYLKKTGWKGMYWIYLFSEWEQVKMVMNFCFRRRWWIYWLTEWLSASQEEFCSMELVIQILILTSVILVPGCGTELSLMLFLETTMWPWVWCCYSNAFYMILGNTLY